MNKALAFIRGELGAALIRTFMARGVSAIGGVLLVIVLGREFGAAGVGSFALAQSVYLGASLLSQGGMNNTLVRYVGANPTSSSIRVYLSWSSFRVCTTSVAVAACIFLGRSFIERWFKNEALSVLLGALAWGVPALALSFVLSGFMKGVRRPATASLLENGSISLVAAAILILLQSTLGSSLSHAGWALTLAAWLVVGQGVIQAKRHLGSLEMKESDQIGKSEFFATSRSFFVMSLAQFMQQVVSVLIAGALLDPRSLGLFRAAERSALLINFVLVVINAVFPARFSAAFHSGDMRGLRALARKGVLLGLLLSSPMLLICVLVPEFVMSFFGDEFADASALLRIIALAQLINVATGSVAFLLNMTGNERLMRNIAIISNVIGLGSFVVLIHLWSALGAAISLAIILVCQNLTAVVFVWRKLGIWTLPVPNFLYWLRPESSAGANSK